ncbi:hypothetical protein BH11MYX1_BH11MYX1_16460 [soil metagenome]
MYDFESINAEQLVTRTDVVLLGDLSKRRAAARGSLNFTVAAVRREIRSASAHDERTVIVRLSPKMRASYRLCAVATIAWCCVAAVCLHL